MDTIKHTTTSLLPFTYQEHDVPVCINDAGDPLWRAADVGKVLEYTGDMGQHIRRLDDDERTLISNQGGQKEWWITESGLYALILGSRKKAAKDFKRWVTHEVIPQIRKTGQYTHRSAPLTTAQMLLAQAQVMVKLEEKQLLLEAKQEQQAVEIAALKERRPPQGKLRIEDWRRREGKPYLNDDLMQLLRDACNRRERPALFRPEGMDYPLRYYTPNTIAGAYEEVTRQLRFLIHDPAVAYKRQRRHGS